MSIRQFNGNYIPNEDRLMFRFNTTDNSEYRLWLTRRITLFIMTATEHLVEKKLEQTHEKAAAKAIAQFQQESVKEAANFSAEYRTANKYPIGADPVLVIDAKCTMMKVESIDVLSLDLVMPGGANLTLKLTIPILQTMLLLLERLAAQAGWVQPAPKDPPGKNISTTDLEPKATDSDLKKNLH